MQYHMSNLRIMRNYGGVLINISKACSISRSSDTRIVFTMPISNWLSGNWIYLSDSQTYQVSVNNAEAEIKSIMDDLNEYYNRKSN